MIRMCQHDDHDHYYTLVDPNVMPFFRGGGHKTLRVGTSEG
jgi:hypothetical protein